MRSALLFSIISICFLFSQAVQAKSQLDAATLKQLTMLEQKFFGHTYDNETDEERTERIEKLILGSAGEGAAPVRIKKLASVTYLDTRPDPVETPASQPKTAVAPTPVPAPVVAPVPVPVSVPIASSPTPKAPSVSPSTPSTKSGQSAALNDDYDAPVSKPGADDYPHVTALEKEILGATYVGQPLSARIVRMETKAFGAASKSDDLGERTDNLESYAEQKLHKKPFLVDETADATIEETPYPEQSQSDGGSTHLQSDYPHITALENSILGQASPSLPLEKRISAMEVKAFGAVSKSDDLSGRTDALEKYAEKTLHKKPYGADLNYETADGSGAGAGKPPESKGMKLLNMVGNSLLGIGTGGMGPGGMAVPGMGMMGPGSTGFSGIRVRRRQAPAEEPSAADEPTGPIEDPMVRAKDPPPASARLAIRVGWCEMHVFGRTSPNMHLAERLTLLNRELKFDPGKGPMELMDHIDDLVKSAQAYRAPSIVSTPQSAGRTGAAIGASPAAATH